MIITVDEFYWYIINFRVYKLKYYDFVIISEITNVMILYIVHVRV